MRDATWHDGVDERLRDHDVRLAEVEDTTRKLRSRVHSLEGGRRALELAALAIEQLAARAHDAFPDLDELVDRAVLRALARARREHAKKRRRSWTYRCALAGAAAAVIYTGLELVLALVRI